VEEPPPPPQACNVKDVTRIAIASDFDG